MARTARPIDYDRIRRLQQQIDDPVYVDSAIDRLAGRITARLLGFDREEPQLTYRSASSSRMANAEARVDDEYGPS